ncbi:hypothetical protein CHUAL_010153 [Chamberlinius hualienensis]
MKQIEPISRYALKIIVPGPNVIECQRDRHRSTVCLPLDYSQLVAIHLPNANNYCCLDLTHIFFTYIPTKMCATSMGHSRQRRTAWKGWGKMKNDGKNSIDSGTILRQLWHDY